VTGIGDSRSNLQFHHGHGFLETALRQFHHLEEDLFRRQPGHVELFPPERTPAFRGVAGQRFAGLGDVLMAQHKAIPLGVEIPQAGGCR